MNILICIMTLSLYINTSYVATSSLSNFDYKFDDEPGISDKYAANVSLYCYPGAGSNLADDAIKRNFGHAFVVIQNLKTDLIKIGKMSVNMYKYISIGKWKIEEHQGIWYNIELSRDDIKSSSDMIYLNEYITDNQLNELNTYLCDVKIDTYDKFNDNCSTFAINIWNKISTRKVDAGQVNSPLYLYNSMENYDYLKNSNMPYENRVGYYTNDVFMNVSSIDLIEE